MATIFAEKALEDKAILLIPFGITGGEIQEFNIKIKNNEFKLINIFDEDQINLMFKKIKDKYENIIIVDFTIPSAVENNISLYCRQELNFIIGTTGITIEKVIKVIKNTNINAVISPNMGKQIVAIQAMFEYISNTFPKCFEGYSLRIKESHQQGKLDTSGTAKLLAGYLKELGADFDIEEIEKVRDPERQIEMGIPEDYLDGHGWHTYTLLSNDETVTIEIKHNVNGSDVYAKGTIDSIKFLNQKINEGCKGKSFSMIDVLKGIK